MVMPELPDAADAPN